MILLRRIGLIPLFLALAFSLAEAKRPAKRAALQPRGDCKVMSDSLLRLYEAGDPAYLTWDFSAAKCDPAQLYQAYYYQGIGFLFISAWKEALYFLTEARDIGGGKDEEILYHLWTVYQKLDRYQEMERLTLELHQRYPSSLFLLEILDQWKSVRASRRSWSWGYSSRAAWAGTRTPYLDHIVTNRVSGETGQKWAGGQLRETGSISVKSKWDSRLFQGSQTNLGVEYERKGASLEADWGAGFESQRDSYAVLFSNGSGSLLSDSSWNYKQGRLVAGYSYTTNSGWNLAANASFYQFSPDWRVLGVNHSQSILFADFILIGYAEVQKHWLTPNPEIRAAEARDLDGIMTYSFTLTPYFAWGRHSLGVGGTYYASRMHYAGGIEGADSLAAAEPADSDWQHSLTGTASYGFDLRSWCRLAASFSYGFDFNNRPETTEYIRKTVYGLDAGFSLSY